MSRKASLSVAARSQSSVASVAKSSRHLDARCIATSSSRKVFNCASSFWPAMAFPTSLSAAAFNFLDPVALLLVPSGGFYYWRLSCEGKCSAT